MRSKQSYEHTKEATMNWKRTHKARTRWTQYKTYSKHWVMNSNPKELKWDWKIIEKAQKELDSNQLITVINKAN